MAPSPPNRSWQFTTLAALIIIVQGYSPFTCLTLRPSLQVRQHSDGPWSTNLNTCSIASFVSEPYVSETTRFKSNSVASLLASRYLSGPSYGWSPYSGPANGYCLSAGSGDGYSKGFVIWRAPTPQCVPYKSVFFLIILRVAVCLKGVCVLWSTRLVRTCRFLRLVEGLFPLP